MFCFDLKATFYSRKNKATFNFRKKELQYIYAAGGSEGLFIFDVSDPENPLLVGRCDTAGYAYGVSVAGNYLYVADGNNGLVVIDVSDPANPVENGHYDTDGYAQGVTIKGNYAYVADGGNGFVVIDISDPTNPKPVSDMLWITIHGVCGQ